MEEKKKFCLEEKEIFEELKENPIHKFNIAFALMSIIPILGFMYILAGELFSFKILTGNVGFIVLVAILISLSGFYIGYLVIKNLLSRVITYMIKLRENDKQKSVFVAHVSHEIKNPLATLDLSICTILDSIVDKIDEEQKDMFRSCNNLCGRLIRFTTEMLNVSKIESGIVELKRSFWELDVLLEEEIKTFETAFARKKIQLAANRPFPKISIWADRDKISQVIFNIIDNAIKYTPENGKVSIELAEEKWCARIEICDTGEGIPENRIGRIFNRFDKITSKQNSIGLGLLIAKDFIDLHKGTISVESKLHEGSKFIVILPKDLRSRNR